MWHRNFRLAFAAVTLALVAPPLEAQVTAVPPGVAALRTYEIPERMLTACPELSLSADQVRALKALAAELRLEDAQQRVSSKPWVTAALQASPEQAYTKALGLIDAKERSQAATLFTTLARRCG